MKLIELDSIDQTNNEFIHTSSPISDETYSKPYVLSALDRLMNDILKKSGLSDGEKWQLYNQTLQRYLNFVKAQSKEKNSASTSIQSKAYDSNLDDTRRDFTLLRDSSFNMSGVDPIRDSLDTISVPVVRDFFMNAREKNDPLNTSWRSLPSPQPQQQQPSLPKVVNERPKKKAVRKVNHYIQFNSNPSSRSKAVAKKRHAEALLSQIRPRKVIAWEPTNAD